MPQTSSKSSNDKANFSSTLFDQVGFECSSKVVPTTFYDYVDTNYKLSKVLARDLFLKALETKNLFDPVTGFDLAGDRLPSLVLATKFALQEAVNFAYVEIDLRNLGGLNSYFGANEAANSVYKMMSSTVQSSLEKVLNPQAKLCSFRHGGDEFSFLVWGNIAKYKIEQALMNAQESIAAKVKAQGLDKIDHPKHSGDPKYAGTGIYFGVSLASEVFPQNQIPFGTRVAAKHLPNEESLKKLSIEMILAADKIVNANKH